MRLATGAVQVFNAQKQAPAGLGGEPLVQERRIGVAEMERAVRRRREAQDGRGREGVIGHGGESACIKPAARATRAARPAAKRPYHPGPPIADEATLHEAAERLRAKDPELIERLAAIGGPPPLRRREPGFAGLAAIIVSQQLSVASASAIFGRLEARVAPLEAARTRQGDGGRFARLRIVDGQNPRVARARRRRSSRADSILAGMAALDAEDAHKALVTVKGVGPWTADIFLLFCLGHPDAFPAGDLALQEAAKLALGPQAPARRGAARADRRALAAMARRRRAHALGLLPRRQGALGDGPRRWFGLRPNAAISLGANA